jgi:two-component system OmpR family sensor kinase
VRPRSFRTRLTLVHLAAVLAAVGLTAFATHWQLARAVHGQLDAELLALAETESLLLADTAQPVRVHDMPAGPSPPSFVRLDRLVQISDAKGHVLARSANLGAARLPVRPPLLARLAAGKTVTETLRDFGEEPVRLISVPVEARGGRYVVQVAGSVEDADRAIRFARVLFLVMALALLAAVGTAAAVLTRRAFRPIDAVVDEAHRIGEADLRRRLPHPGTRDEIGRLVTTLNDMLDRIERSFESQRRFTADASHELRSPLSRLRAELEVMLRRPRERAEYEETLRSCLDEAERLSQLTDELLLLARLDAGEARLATDTVALHTVAEVAIRRMERASGERQGRIAIAPSPPVVARVGREPAALVVQNLLENALKFSPPDSPITISLGAEGDEVLLSVSDRGPGISPDELPRVFERFYRGRRARAEAVPGVGLGLALSRAVVEAHGGRITVQSPPGGGTTFTVRLPAAA